MVQQKWRRRMREIRRVKSTNKTFKALVHPSTIRPTTEAFSFCPPKDLSERMMLCTAWAYLRRGGLLVREVCTVCFSCFIFFRYHFLSFRSSWRTPLSWGFPLCVEYRYFLVFFSFCFIFLFFYLAYNHGLHFGGDPMCDSPQEPLLGTSRHTSIIYRSFIVFRENKKNVFLTT